MSIPIPQVALVAGALLAGVLLDRVIVGNRSAPSTEGGSANSSVPNVASPESGAAVSSVATPLVEEQRAVADSTNTARLSLDGVLSQRDPLQRTHDLQTYINALQPREFADALKRLRQLTGSNERELASRLLVAQWVATDPNGALQFAAANRGYEYLADDVFQQRAASDFQSALTQAQEIPGNDLRYRALRGILSYKADMDPTGAIQLAQSLGPFPGNEPLSNVLYRQWAATDPQAAALYAAQQGQGGGWRSPVNQVVNTWAEHDPVAAANWSLGLSDSEAQGRALAQVMRDWGRQDPAATANWIHALPAGAQHDLAVAGFAESMVSADPQNALNWIGNIADESVRQRALQQVSRQVMWRDPENGAALLQAAGLAPNQIPQAQATRQRPGRAR